MLQVNEAIERFNKIELCSSLSEWKNEWIRLTIKTKQKKEKHRNAFANNESWMTNDKGRMINDKENDDGWKMNDELQIMKDEWQMM